MSDRPSEVTAFMQPMHVSSASLGRAAGWLKCRCAALNVSGFPAVLAGLLLFSPLIDGGTTQLPVLIIRLILVITGGVWLFARMKAGEVFLPHSRLDACVAVFGGWAILSLAWSPYKNASVQWVLNILSYTAFFAMVTQGIRSDRHIRTLLAVATGMGMFEGLLGLAQYVWMDEARARGTFFNPNFFAAYEAAIGLLSLGVLLFADAKTYSPWVRRWLWATTTIAVAAFVTAQSRGAALALLGALSVLAFSRYGKKACMILTVCLLAGILVPNPLQQRTLQVAEHPYAYTRLDIWKSSVARVIEHPLGIGVGMYKQGSFQERFPIEGELVRYGKRPESAHNEYLQIGVELGLVGLLIFFCGIGVWAAEVTRLLRDPAVTMERGLAMGATVSALMLLLHASVDSSFHEPALVLLLIFMGGLLHSFYLRSRPEAVIWRRIGFAYHPLRAVCVVLIGVIIATISVQSAWAWYAHEAGKHRAAQQDLEGALAWYIRAADIDPATTGYHDSIARTAMELYAESGRRDWLLTAAEEEAVARKLNPADARFAFRAGTVYRLMAAQTVTGAQRTELLSKAADAYSEAIRLDPYSPFSYLELAQLRLAESRVNDAIALLTTAAAHEPNFLPGRALLAEQSLLAGLPGDYRQEYSAIKAVLSKYAHQELTETERRFLDVDLYPLGRALAMEPKP